MISKLIETKITNIFLENIKDKQNRVTYYLDEIEYNMERNNKVNIEDLFYQLKHFKRFDLNDLYSDCIKVFDIFSNIN